MLLPAPHPSAVARSYATSVPSAVHANTWPPLMFGSTAIATAFSDVALSDSTAAHDVVAPLTTGTIWTLFVAFEPDCTTPRRRRPPTARSRRRRTPRPAASGSRSMTSSRCGSSGRRRPRAIVPPSPVGMTSATASLESLISSGWSGERVDRELLAERRCRSGRGSCRRPCRSSIVENVGESWPMHERPCRRSPECCAVVDRDRRSPTISTSGLVVECTQVWSARSSNSVHLQAAISKRRRGRACASEVRLPCRRRAYPGPTCGCERERADVDQRPSTAGPCRGTCSRSPSAR